MADEPTNEDIVASSLRTDEEANITDKISDDEADSPNSAIFFLPPYKMLSQQQTHSQICKFQ